MSNPNTNPFSVENDDEDDDGFTPFIPSRPKKPLPVNDKLINFSLNKQKEQQDHHAKEQAGLNKEESEDEKESETTPATTRRKRAGRSLRKLLKRSRSKPEEPLRTTEFTQLVTANTTMANAGLEAATVKQPAGSTQEAPTISVSSPNIIAPSKDNKPDNEPQLQPPVLPRRPPASLPSSPGGGGNLTSIPAAITAAEATPPPLRPDFLDRTPSRNEKGDGSGPAWMAFMAATYFRRRGEERINRKLKKVNEELEQTRAPRTELAVENHTPKQPSPANTLEVVNRPRPVQPEVARPVPLAEKQTEALTRPVLAAEIFAASPLAKEIAHKEAVKQAENLEKPEKIQTADKTEREEQLNQGGQANQIEQPERAGNSKTFLKDSEVIPQIVKESVFDRHSEVKDKAAAKTKTWPITAPAHTKTSPHVATQIGNMLPNKPVNTQSGKYKAAQSDQPQDLYRQSMRAGFLAGIIVIILGIIAFVIQK